MTSSTRGIDWILQFMATVTWELWFKKNHISLYLLEWTEFLRIKYVRNSHIFAIRHFMFMKYVLIRVVHGLEDMF